MVLEKSWHKLCVVKKSNHPHELRRTQCHESIQLKQSRLSVIPGLS